MRWDDTFRIQRRGDLFQSNNESCENIWLWHQMRKHTRHNSFSPEGDRDMNMHVFLKFAKGEGFLCSQLISSLDIISHFLFLKQVFSISLSLSLERETEYRHLSFSSHHHYYYYHPFSPFNPLSHSHFIFMDGREGERIWMLFLASDKSAVQLSRFLVLFSTSSLFSISSPYSLEWIHFTFGMIVSEKGESYSWLFLPSPSLSG